jgi:phytoene synthase
MDALQRAALAEVERDGFRVLTHRTSLTPLRKLWLAWKTSFVA